MNPDFALRARDQLLSVSRQLDELLAEYQNNLPEEDFIRCRTVFGSVMGEMAIELLFPIYREFPDLAPEWFSTPQS